MRIQHLNMSSLIMCQGDVEFQILFSDGTLYVTLNDHMHRRNIHNAIKVCYEG